MDYCANCDNEATICLTINEQLLGKTYDLLLCTGCNDAFQWGITHAKDTVEEEPIGEELCP
jgi:hypothetical protein